MMDYCDNDGMMMSDGTTMMMSDGMMMMMSSDDELWDEQRERENSR